MDAINNLYKNNSILFVGIIAGLFVGALLMCLFCCVPLCIYVRRNYCKTEGTKDDDFDRLDEVPNTE